MERCYRTKEEHAALLSYLTNVAVEAVAAHRGDLANMEAEMRAHEAAVTDLLRAKRTPSPPRPQTARN